MSNVPPSDPPGIPTPDGVFDSHATPAAPSQDPADTPAAPYTAPAGYSPPAASPYGQPAPGYSQPAAPYPGAYTPTPSTNTLAIITLILAFFVPVGAIITGHIALGQIKKTGEGGRGLGLAGLILGYSFTALWLLFFIGYILFFVVLFGAAGLSAL